MTRPHTIWTNEITVCILTYGTKALARECGCFVPTKLRMFEGAGTHACRIVLGQYLQTYWIILKKKRILFDYSGIVLQVVLLFCEFL
jgi:hypothetical protein